MYNTNYAQMFPQPNGNVYVIQNSLEVANIPAGAGLTAALCLPENLMYLKTIQNGVPSFLAYKLVPYSEAPQQKQAATNSLENRVAALEQKISSLGGGQVNELKPTVAKSAAPDNWDA